MTPDAPLRAALLRLASGDSLSTEAAEAAFGVIAAGAATPAQTGAILMALRAKGETADEVAGAAYALRAAMVRLESANRHALVDTCGTGGGRVRTFNISSAAAFVVAAAGVPVAKHGNRSYTSRSGSADVFEALGIAISLPPSRAAEVLECVGLVFLFAPDYQPAGRHFAATRKELGVPTIMNLVGPLVSPAAIVRQATGVGDRSRAPLVANALAQLGTTHALVLHADVGMDEISPSGKTQIWEVTDGAVRTWSFDPGDYGLADDDLAGLAGGEPADNAARIERLLHGNTRDGTRERGTRDHVARCATLLNAAASLYVSGNGWSFEACVARATEALDSGGALDVLRRLRAAAPLSTSG